MILVIRRNFHSPAPKTIKKYFIFFFTQSILAGILISALHSAWYSNWNYRKPLSNRRACGADLPDFPLLVRISNDSDLRDYASNNGHDIVFTLQADTKKLAHEIEYFSNGTLIAWVKIPFFSTSEPASNHLYMYFNNGTGGNQQNVSAVWSENYLAVWHLKETSGNVIDSTVSAYIATNFIADQANGIYPDGSLDVPGVAGSGGLFLTNDNLRTPKLTLSSPLTYSAWMYADSDAAWWGSVPTGARGSFGRYYQNDSVNMWKSGAATMTTRVGITIDGASYLSTAPQPSFAAKTWVYIAVTYDGTAIKYQMIYINYHIIKRINQ